MKKEKNSNKEKYSEELLKILNKFEKLGYTMPLPEKTTPLLFKELIEKLVELYELLNKHPEKITKFAEGDFFNKTERVVMDTIKRSKKIKKLTSGLDETYEEYGELLYKITQYVSKQYKELVELRLKNADPKNFHYFEVKNAYKNGNSKIVIILLSVFFETVVKEKLKGYFIEKRQNENVGIEFIEDIRLNYELILKISRLFEIIKENEFDVLNKLRISRNEYVHNLYSFSMDRKTPIEEKGELEIAIKLYEGWIGIENSMLDYKE